MQKLSTVDFCDRNWEVTAGCSKVSEGCDNCYACRRAATRLTQNAGTPFLSRRYSDGYQWIGEPQLLEHKLNEPLHWYKPGRIVVNSRSDLFHEAVPESFIDEVLTRIDMSPRHTFVILTKRPERAARALKTLAPRHQTRDEGSGRVEWPLPNLWIGVSVENQRRADERVPALLDIPAAVRVVSVEPMLGRVDLLSWLPRIDWVICGGEFGPKARPLHPEWARDLLDHCVMADVPFYFKGWGQWAPVGAAREFVEGDGSPSPGSDTSTALALHRGNNHLFGDGIVVAKVGMKAAGRLLDGREWRQTPGERHGKGAGSWR